MPHQSCQRQNVRLGEFKKKLNDKKEHLFLNVLGQIQEGANSLQETKRKKHREKQPRIYSKYYKLIIGVNFF